ncbi:MAG TPA: peptidoglycan DD-metalloendopeptidase family protein [Solirubrobacteraceae bacterium]|nr:peptidoglycan DD-metalloendopeptidase family protein [Solirubrobacteraceae bacterium]
MRLRVLLACAVLPFVLWALLPVPSSGQSSGKIQEKIESTRGKIGKKKGTERVLSQDIQQYTSRIRRLENRIGSLQTRQQRLQADLDAKRAVLVRTQAELRSERARLAKLRARLIVARRTLAGRLVEMYKADKPDALSVVLNSDGFAELLERGEFIARIAESDRKIVTVVKSAKADAVKTEKRLDTLEARQQRVAAQVLARRNEVAQVKEEVIGTKVGMESTKRGKERALSKVKVDRHELESHLKSLEKEQAKIQARLARVSSGGGAVTAGGPPPKGSGQLNWPVNAPISSGFGGRSSPGGIGSTFHQGVDLPVPVGTPIHAADGGRVAVAGVMGGYGNYTCIQHTGSLSTCYAHQSSIGVSVGQSVTQGQVIGMSGNTGNSTGPHLHFEVRVNGTAVDPMGYL